jgi:hypothetical protein
MNRAWILMAIAAVPVLLSAQDSASRSDGGGQAYTPAVPQASMVSGYGWGGYNTGASTAAGSAMNGMASAISAAGDYNLATSAAVVNLTQAQSNEIKNRQDWTNTYFEMQATNKAARDAARGKPLTMEQLANIAQQGVPKPLDKNQLNPVSGKLNWPGPLQEDGFASRRAEMDKLMEQYTNYGGLSYADQTKVKGIVNSMFKDLKAQINTVPSDEYIAARTFLNSVLYASAKARI